MPISCLFQSWICCGFAFKAKADSNFFSSLLFFLFSLILLSTALPYRIEYCTLYVQCARFSFTLLPIAVPKLMLQFIGGFRVICGCLKIFLLFVVLRLVSIYPKVLPALPPIMIAKCGAVSFWEGAKMVKLTRKQLISERMGWIIGGAYSPDKPMRCPCCKHLVKYPERVVGIGADPNGPVLVTLCWNCA